MIAILRCFAVFLFFISSLTPLSAARIINFSDDGTMAAVFASGLRPWRYEGSLDRCEISSQSITLLLPDGRKISDFPVESGSFRAFGDYELTESDFTSGLLSVADAASLVKKIARDLGFSADAIDSLAARASAASTAPRWSEQVSAGNLTIGLQFTAIPQFNDVKATVDLRLNWTRPVIGRRYWTEPMPPPPGYERVGFGTPPPFGSPQMPNPGPEYYERLIRAQKGARPVPESSEAKVTASEAPRSDLSSVTTEEPVQHRIPAVLVSALVLVLVGGAVFIWRRCRSDD